MPKPMSLRGLRDMVPWSAGKRCSTAGIGLMVYHGVVHRKGDLRLERNFHSLSEFRLHMQFLRRHSIVPLSEVMAKVARGRGFPRWATVITFDDGYANNVLAADILAEARLPWTVFVSTGAIGLKGIIWTVELSLLLLHGRANKLDSLGQTWPLATREERESAFQAIRFPMKVMPTKLRQETMNEIRGQFPVSETQRLLEQFPAFRMLTWKEIRQLSETGVEIGSHGVDHEIHHQAQTPELRRRELVESKKEIERQIGKPCRFFAFPNGDSCELSAREVEEAGYEMAFTTKQEFVHVDSNRFLLPRISPGGSVANLSQRLVGLLSSRD
jgi:peptidoglycan/xylan/chitin deacetylase (PgdA/CDA1 family)